MDSNAPPLPPPPPTGGAAAPANSGAKKMKLKSLGKHGKETRITTTYDAEGNWTSTQRQEDLRLLTNAKFDRYYGELQDLGKVALHGWSAHLSSAGAGGSGEQSGQLPQTSAAAWEHEMSLFRTPLPTTLWINDTDPLAPEVSRYLQSLDRTAVEPIPWYPIEGMAWRVLADKTAFRKRPELQELRHYLIRQTALGTISRQEEVSMIPPFLLDVQPTDVCLDMCASPGSKTAQMLVALGRHKKVPFASEASPFPFDYASEGLVMANELDTKRANMLVHQVKRLRLLFPFALFTNHDARFFPETPLDAPSPAPASVVGGGTQSAAAGVVAEANPQTLRFDKILCDVVCSGDGTLRKAPHIFKIWSPREAISLQKTQIQIALRASHLLRVGGRLVYSTCSLNPIENEAVVAQIVHRTRGAMQLVDARKLLPQLACAPGMQTWAVTNMSGTVVTAPDRTAHEALFPPHTPGAYTSDAVDALDLSLCMRLLPSHCNGGGFFIAVLDKVKEFRLVKRAAGTAETTAAGSGEPPKESTPTSPPPPPSQAAAAAAAVPSTLTAVSASTKRERPARQSVDGKATTADAPTTATTTTPSTRKGEAMEEEEEEEEPPAKKPKGVPPQYRPAPALIHTVLRDFYEIANFPLPDHLLVRNNNGEAEARLTPSSICTIVSKTALRVLQQKTDSLVVVSAGLRIFAYETLDKGWRIASESALLFAKLMRHSSRLLKVSVDLVRSMITHGGKLKEKALDAIEDPALRATVEGLSLGTVLLEIAAPKAVGGVFYSVGLRARSRLQLLVDHEDLVGMQLRLGLEPQTPIHLLGESPAAEGGEEGGEEGQAGKGTEEEATSA